MAKKQKTESKMKALHVKYAERCARIVDAGSEAALDAAEFLEAQAAKLSPSGCRDDYAQRYVRTGTFDGKPLWMCQGGETQVSEADQPRLKNYVERRNPDVRIHCDTAGYCSAVLRPEPLFQEGRFK